MSTSQQYIDTTPLEVIKRRPVGKREWKVTIQELIESERAGLQLLRGIGNRHPNDAEVQRALATLSMEAAERLNKLYELLNYRSEKEEAS